jgi:hypothetical protein
MNKPIHDSEEMCPLMKSKRKLVCHKCAWYNHIRGKNPQSNEEMDYWDCAVAMLPILMVETGRQQMTTSESVLSLRNEFVEGNNKRIATDLLRTQALIRAKNS